MRLRRVTVLFLLGASCAQATVPGATAPVERARPAGATTRADYPGAPRPHARIPWDPDKLAARLDATSASLRDALTDWIGRGSPGGRAEMRPLRLWGLYHQRIFRRLTKKSELARAVLKRIENNRRFTRATLAIGRRLRSLARPVKPPVRMKTHAAQHPDRLIRHYRKAHRRFGIPVAILASVNFVESKFGRVLGPSSAGALGPMQFLPSTWDRYGRGDIMDPHDSIMAAGRYLRASGGQHDIRSALYAYNRSWIYVNAIETYARQMVNNDLNYYVYYLWQVFVITTKGDKQLTGPGSRSRG